MHIQNYEQVGALIQKRAKLLEGHKGVDGMKDIIVAHREAYRPVSIKLPMTPAMKALLKVALDEEVAKVGAELRKYGVTAETHSDMAASERLYDQALKAAGPWTDPDDEDHS